MPRSGIFSRIGGIPDCCRESPQLLSGHELVSSQLAPVPVDRLLGLADDSVAPEGSGDDRRPQMAPDGGKLPSGPTKLGRRGDRTAEAQ